jgi:hypothetical protein
MEAPNTSYTSQPLVPVQPKPVALALPGPSGSRDCVPTGRPCVRVPFRVLHMHVRSQHALEVKLIRKTNQPRKGPHAEQQQLVDCSVAVGARATSSPMVPIPTYIKKQKKHEKGKGTMPVPSLQAICLDFVVHLVNHGPPIYTTPSVPNYSSWF